jgi:streptogramin lyase
MKEDSKGIIWLVSAGFSGISRFDPGTGNLISYIDTTIDLTLKYKELYIDKDDKLWIMPHNEGLFSFDPSTGKFKQFSSNGDGKGTNGKLINGIIEKDNRHYGLVDQGGINRFDKVSNF